jgi:hypothetical protein
MQDRLGQLLELRALGAKSAPHTLTLRTKQARNSTHKEACNIEKNAQYRRSQQNNISKPGQDVDFEEKKYAEKRQKDSKEGRDVSMAMHVTCKDDLRDASQAYVNALQGAMDPLFCRRLHVKIVSLWNLGAGELDQVLRYVWFQLGLGFTFLVLVYVCMCVCMHVCMCAFRPSSPRLRMHV